MSMRALELKKDIDRYEGLINEYIKWIGEAEKEIEAINILLESVKSSS